MPGLRRASLEIGVGVLVLGVLVIATRPASAVRSSAALHNCRPVVGFDRHDFPARPRVDNRFSPLRRGSVTVLSGSVRGDDGELHAHKVVSVASAVTKTLDGVVTRVVLERDYEDGQLQESELAFAAQGRHGRVWNVGEYPEEYDGGALVGADTWISGIAHARAGLAMRAHPRLHSRAYLQGKAPGVGFRDCGKVKRRGMHRCEPTGCYAHVLVVVEWAPLEPTGGLQLKYYAPRVGVIEVGAVGGANREVLHLVRHTVLGPAALARVNRRVLAQDRRGYRVSPRVYGRTSRAVLRPNS